MLLYDRVAELLLRARQRKRLRATELAFLSDLRKAQVYECSNVMPLMTEWEDGKGNGISKRPPGGPVWVEWRDASGGSVDTIGGLIARTSPEYALSMLKTVDPNDPHHAKIKNKTFDEFYISTSFIYSHSCSEGRSPQRPLNLVIQYRHYTIWYGTPGMEEVEGVLLGWPRDHDQDHLCFDQTTATVPRQSDGSWGFDAYQWPAFMAFALLHCKNVATETHRPDERVRRRAERSGSRRTVYKTLHLELPKHQSGSSHSQYGIGDDGPKVKFHLCRGHFKNLQHERYKSKGWHWWPAHWKGSRSLGSVQKTYELDSSE